MRISVIIPTCNRNDLLSRCLSNLSPSSQTLLPEYYEVIVSDDSKNGIAKLLVEEKYNWAHWNAGPQKGPAANRNAGAKLAQGDWLVFIDDDCIPSADLLVSYYNIIKDGKYHALEGAILNEREKERFDEEAPLNINGGNFWSCNIAIEKSLFYQIKGFDEGFPYPALEDTDLHARIKVITNPFFVKQASVVHPWRRITAFKSYKKWIESNRYYLKKINAKKDFTFRVTRFKLMIGNLIGDLKELKKLSYKGIGFFFERFLFNFLMMFI